MVKEALDLRQDSLESLTALLQQWLPDAAIASFRKMNGGYSGTNYEIVCVAAAGASSTTTKYALKICNGYATADIEAQAQCTAFLANNGFADRCCYSLPTAATATAAGGRQYTALTADGVPATLLNFVEGRAADYVIESRPASVAVGTVLRACGAQLAALHSVAGPGMATLRTYEDGGACLVGQHLRGHFLALFDATDDPHVAAHPYVAFYRTAAPGLVADMAAAAAMPQGVLHGDAFLDNVLVDEVSGEFRSFVDFEDVARGPCLFDLAVCAVGNCFDAANALSMDALEALLAGYQAARRLAPLEVDLFVPFLQHALLCNATWRFVNFNITHPHLRAEFGDKYKELYDRWLHLDRDDVKARVREAVARQL